ncbi:hypothetical protein WK78_26645 [Burkholderia cepacia]|uniref:hypothetical protein n=1 Tax=Burkholderia cepacia TaxID=292 RepID=UPI00075A38CC|nr:hypothetical protein [Burkholderia cepacia]KVV20891.1 hypothetical protein WK78_26645 [Burkholderia cepacia]
MSNIYLNADDNAVFQDLMGRFIDLDEEDMKKLTALRKKSQDAKGKRDKLVSDVLDSMKKVLPAMTLEEIFGENLGAVLADAGYVHESAIPKAGKGKGSSASKASSTSRASNANPVLIQSKPVGKGRGWAYHQGRVFEAASDAVKQPWAQFPDALLQHGQSEESLLDIATDEGKKYFAKEEGKAELAKLVALAKEAKAKADAKTPAAAPAAAAKDKQAATA